MLLQTCRECSTKVSNCPICRQRITNRLRLFTWSLLRWTMHIRIRLGLLNLCGVYIAYDVYDFIPDVCTCTFVSHPLWYIYVRTYIFVWKLWGFGMFFHTGLDFTVLYNPASENYSTFVSLASYDLVSHEVMKHRNVKLLSETNGIKTHCLYWNCIVFLFDKRCFRATEYQRRWQFNLKKFKWLSVILYHRLTANSACKVYKQFL